MKFWSNSEIYVSGPQVPEKRLLAAVLQRAVTDFLTGQGELRESAYIWIKGEEASDAPLTFDFICEALDLDATGLRSAIYSQADNQVECYAGQAVN